MSFYLDRNVRPGEFPVRAAVAKGSGRDDDSRMEISFSDILTGSAVPRSVFQIAGLGDLPLVRESFEQLTRRTPLNDLGISFDYRNEAIRQVGAGLLRRFRTREQLLLSDAELKQVKSVIQSMEDVSQPRLQDAMRQLRGLGSQYVWRDLENRGGAGVQRFDVGYDRFQAAGNTEVAFGAENAAGLHKHLAAIAVDRKLPEDTRCDALDLIGQFGLPPLSPRLAELETALHDDPAQELPVVLSSVRVRQSVAEDADIRRLHQAVTDNRLRPGTVTLAIEALAIVDELAPHAKDLDGLIKADTSEPGTVSRRAGALAATAVGQAALLDLLEQQQEKLPPRDGIAALAQSLRPGHKNWARLVRLAKGIALNAANPVPERMAANEIVRQDAEALASSYTEEFFQSTLACGDFDLLSRAIGNMVAIGREETCFETVQGKLAAAEPANRMQAAIWSVALAKLARNRGPRLLPSFWRNLDVLLQDADPVVRSYGTLTLLTLFESKVAVPKSYVSKVVESAVAEQDSTNLALACAALVRLTDSDYTPPFDRVAPPSEIRPWIEENADRVRDHLRHWHQEWLRKTGRD